MFFKLDSAELTPDDRTSLDSYAAKYVAAASAEAVKVEGFASVDGPADHNMPLSQQRAQAVADYLVSKGIPKDKVSARGLGETDKFSKTDLPANRRATVAPKPPSAPAPATPVPPGPTGPAGQNPLDPSSDAFKKAMEETLKNSAEAEDWIRNRLTSNKLRPDPNNSSGDMVMYKDKTTRLTDVIDETVKDGKAAPIKAPSLVTEQTVQRIAGQVLLAASPGGGKMGGKSLVNISVYLQYTFIPSTPGTVHTPIPGGPETKDQPAHQVQFQITAELHGKDESGIEVSGTVTGAFFADEKGKSIKWQSGNVGAQVAWVQTFLDGNLQVGPQLQVTFGGSRAMMNQTQRIDWTPTGQITAAAQAQFKVPGFKGHLLAGWQAGAGVTAPGGGTATVDRSVGFTLTYQF